MTERRRVTQADPRITAGLMIALAILGVAAVVWLIDLTPQVEGDFFFADDDPQMVASRTIAERFPTPSQIIVRAAAGDVTSDEYVAAVAELTEALSALSGLTRVNSISNATPLDSPLWSRLLFAPDGRATNIIAQVGTVDHTTLIGEIENVVRPAESDELVLELSGVPYVVELIRRNLFRDLVIFSTAAFVIFGVLMTLVYRSVRIVIGTLSTCLIACALTLATSQLLGIAIGLLTANIVTIVFVLTLSHIVFLTANWRQAALGELGSTDDPLRLAVGTTREASFWSMLTTLCGFLSLLLASARPLRELGYAGAVGTLVAITVAYAVFPSFLRGHPIPDATPRARVRAPFPRQRPVTWLAGIGVVVVVSALGLRYADTDPSLLSYFAQDDPIREGLEAVDRDGGSSSLLIVVRDSGGARVDTDVFHAKMAQLQQALERDESVGVVLSPYLLLEHARRQPLARLLTWGQLLTILDSPQLDRIASSFVETDRSAGLFSLRMRESGRDRPRERAIDRVRRATRANGFQIELVGGHYELQRQLGELIASSLRLGLGSLLVLFLVIAAVISRRPRTVISMTVCLSAIPILVVGFLGHTRTALDLIASPAANVALAMGVDSMVHLVVRARRRAPTFGAAGALFAAREELWRPILAASLIIAAGFGIFGLSTFPPTQRFGLLVIVGTLTAAVMALIALPFAAGGRPEPE